jgi:sugar phosphate isomerase/epimerase
MHRAISINTQSLVPATLAEHIECVARLGARGISPELEQVTGLGVDAAARQLRDSGLAVAVFTHRAFAFDSIEGIAAARERLLRTIDIAAKIGAQNIIMTTGGRGPFAWPEAARRFAEAIAPGSEAARAAGIGLGIEPTSHLWADASICQRLADTVAVAKMAGIAVMIDVFACWFDADFDEAIAQASPMSPAAQISDYVYGDRGLPCRAVPGDGAVPWERLVPHMVRSGFTGWWDLEIIGPRLQAEGQEAGLRRAAAKIGGLLEQAGVKG